MKKIGFLALTFFVASQFLAAQGKKSKDEMAFDKTVNGVTSHDFGSIVFGANGKVDFHFTNNGTKDLIINDVKSSCGCAVPAWTKEPVKPGQRGTIQIEYNTQLAGAFNKTIVVYSNASNSPVRLEIRGKVNTQASELKPGQVLGGNRNEKKDLELEEEYTQKLNSGNQGETEAQKTAREESFKKLLQQQQAVTTPPPASSQGTQNQKAATTGNKKK